MNATHTFHLDRGVLEIHLGGAQRFFYGNASLDRRRWVAAAERRASTTRFSGAAVVQRWARVAYYKPFYPTFSHPCFSTGTFNRATGVPNRFLVVPQGAAQGAP